MATYIKVSVYTSNYLFIGVIYEIIIVLLSILQFIYTFFSIHPFYTNPFTLSRYYSV